MWSISKFILQGYVGRARPVNITEFGGNKIFSRPFIKSDQCIKNCSWISGETSGAFSLMFGSIIMRNHVFIIFNYLLGLLVFFCRLSMGGHFFSDNIYAFFFMIYLAYLYRIFVCKILKKDNMIRSLIIYDEKPSSRNQCETLLNELKKKKKIECDRLLVRKKSFITYPMY